MALISHWKLDDAAGQKVVVDSQGANEGASANNIVSANGVFGMAINFNGSTDKITAVDTLIADYPFSMSAWFRVAGGQISLTIISLGSSSEQRYVFLGIDSLGKLYMRTRVLATGVGKYKPFSTTVVNDGKWHHGVGVWTSETLRDVYVDGVFEKTDIVSLAFDVAVNQWGIGVNNNSVPAHFFNGDIDDVRIYSGALTMADIRALYRKGVSGYRHRYSGKKQISSSRTRGRY